jgi:hypothetical protein
MVKFQSMKNTKQKDAWIAEVVKTCMFSLVDEWSPLAYCPVTNLQNSELSGISFN